MKTHRRWRGPDIVTVPFTEEGEGGSDQVTLGAVAFALSVGPLSGLPGRWLAISICIGFSPFPTLRSACHLPLHCSVHLEATVYGLPHLVSMPSGTVGGAPSLPGRPWLGQCLRSFCESPPVSEPLTSRTISPPSSLQAGVMVSHCC